MVASLSPTYWIGVAIAVVCGGVIGLERQLRGKPAGIRTSALICLGAQTFVQLSMSLAPMGANPALGFGAVITGVGFLGAGVILSREGLVVGVTSASVIWLLASVGALIGTGRFLDGIGVSLVAVCVLTGVEYIEAVYWKLRTGVHAPLKRRAGRREEAADEPKLTARR